jgi:hypothetical protein
MECKMSPALSFFLVLLLMVASKSMALEGDNNFCPTTKMVASVGAVFYYNSRVGREQKVAMDLAVQDLLRLSCSKQLVLQLKDSHGNSARATSAGKLF